MNVVAEKALCEAFTVVFMLWLAATGALAWLWERRRGR